MQPVLTPEQWAALRDLVLSAGYANTIEALAYELERRGATETAAFLHQAKNHHRDSMGRK